MFNLISFSPHFIDHVSFYFLHSTVHLIYFINIHIYHIWLHSYYIVIQLYCQFHFSANPVLKINDPQVSLDQVLILDIHYLKLNSGGFITPCFFISNEKYNRSRTRTLIWKVFEIGYVNLIFVEIEFPFFIVTCIRNFRLALMTLAFPLNKRPSSEMRFR